MPNVNDMKNSKFLTKRDVEPDKLVTITSCERMDVSMESQPTEMKWCLTFEEMPKPLVLNTTNLNMIAAITGKDETEDWPGEKIVLFNDKTIMFQGRMTGGIRVRADKRTFKQAVKEVEDFRDNLAEEPPVPF
jgi:hypothetical protein